MLRKECFLKVVGFLVFFGLATGVVAGTKNVRIVNDFLDSRQHIGLSVADDDAPYKGLLVDRPVLTEIVSSVWKNRDGGRIDRIVDVHFKQSYWATHVSDYGFVYDVYWNAGTYDRLSSGVEYVKIPVQLDLEIDGEVVEKVHCKWEVYFQANERWEDISVNTMQISSCMHPEIEFTSNTLVYLLSDRLDSVFVSRE